MGTLVRRINAGDADALERFYAELDPDTRWLRFHAATRGLSHTQATWFCRPDVDRHEGFVAVVRDTPGGCERIVAHLCVEPTSATTAEVALVVAPDRQGHGIGRALVEEAVRLARIDGILTLTATMIIGNEPIRRLLTTLDLPTRWTAQGAGTCSLAIDLDRAPVLVAEAPLAASPAA